MDALLFSSQCKIKSPRGSSKPARSAQSGPTSAPSWSPRCCPASASSSLFSYERPLLQKLFDLRTQELVCVRRILVARAGNISIAFSLPVLAAVVSFVVYKATGHELTPGIKFSSLSLFQLLRAPLMLLPQALNAATDAKHAFDRLTPTFTAERIIVPQRDDAAVKVDSSVGVSVDNATFTWESSQAPKPFSMKNLKKAAANSSKGLKKDQAEEGREPQKKPPFRIEHLQLHVRLGEFVALVGAVGSGKSSLLSALLGDMRKTAGTVAFGGGSSSGKIAYIPQTAWCFNGTLKANVLFGQSFQAERYHKCLHDACLLDDLKLFEDGDQTEIGENGITLSGARGSLWIMPPSMRRDADMQDKRRPEAVSL